MMFNGALPFMPVIGVMSAWGLMSAIHERHGNNIKPNLYDGSLATVTLFFNICILDHVRSEKYTQYNQNFSRLRSSLFLAECPPGQVHCALSLHLVWGKEKDQPVAIAHNGPDFVKAPTLAATPIPQKIRSEPIRARGCLFL
jgi:hypothetical protein